MSRIIMFFFIISFTFFFQVVNASEYGIFPKKECTSSNGSGGRECKSSVSIECTYIDSGGDKRSCLAENDSNYFLYQEIDKCGDILATITMKLCNDNEVGQIMPWMDETYFMFAGEQLNASTLFQNPLEPGQCHTVSVNRTINTCNKYPKYWSMGVQFEGLMPDQPSPNYCSCKLYRRSYVKKVKQVKARPTEMKRQCFKEYSNGDVCNSKVSISCEYDQDGETKSCLGYGGDKNSKYPFMNVYEHQCKTVYASISMKMCNYGSSTFYPRANAVFKYQGGVEDTLTTPISQSQCYAWVETKPFDTCAQNSWKMSATMYGNIGSESSLCYCYLFNDSRIYHLPEPPLVALAPSTVPSVSMHPSISAQPSGEPSWSPSGKPSVSSAPSHLPSLSVVPSTTPSDRPSLSSLPSCVPSESPSISSNPSNLPSHFPSSNPSVSVEPSTSQAPSGSQFGFAVCGSTFCAMRTCGKDTDVVVDNCSTLKAVPVNNPEKDLRAVRCCRDADDTDTLSANWRRNFPETCSHGVYGASYLTDNKTCLPQKATFPEAQAACASIDGRLCSIEELQSNCVMNSGCNYDRLMVWSNELQERSNRPSMVPTSTVEPSNTPSLGAGRRLYNKGSRDVRRRVNNSSRSSKGKGKGKGSRNLCQK